MTTTSLNGISHLAVLDPTELRLLQTVCDSQLDSALAADTRRVRGRMDDMDDRAFCDALAGLLAHRLVETDAWKDQWKIWATRHGWATVIESEEG